MKKSIFILFAGLTTLSSAAFGIMNWNPSCESKAIVNSATETEDTNDKQVFDSKVAFFYNVDTRFSGVEKTALDNANSIHDFLPQRFTESIISYHSVEIIVLNDNKQTENRHLGKDDKLTPEQKNLIQSLDYSSNILIRAEFKEKNRITGRVSHGYATPHLTIVPFIQAEYFAGKDALVDYLKNNCGDITKDIDEKKLEPGKLYFTISKDGFISNINLAASSGYAHVDAHMKELLINLPGEWNPAKNIRGEKVEQTLVFSYGIIGC